MLFLLKNISTTFISALLTGLYFNHFYSTDPHLLVFLLILSVLVSLFITLVPVKRLYHFLPLILIPYCIIYSAMYNFFFFVLLCLVSLLLALFCRKKKVYTKYIFTQSNALFAIKEVRKISFVYIFRNALAFFSALLFVLSNIFSSSSYIWLNRAFPIDFSNREILEENVIPLGTISVTAWYDENALLLESFYDIDETTPSPGKVAGLKEGDVITHVDNQPALLSDFIVNGADENPVVLTVQRYLEGNKSEELTFAVTPVFSEKDNLYRIGITYYASAVMTSSVQTMSFVNPNSKTFAATAHSSRDINKNIEDLKGILFSANATGRDKEGLTASLGVPIGETLRSDNYGSYGTLLSASGNAIALGQKKNLRMGPATLLSAFEGGEVKEYDIYITGTYRISSRDVFCFIVTDSRILSLGGITRGMSGSPIIQNGRLIGALSNMDSGGKTGYATFASDMAHSIYMNK